MSDPFELFRRLSKQKKLRHTPERDWIIQAVCGQREHFDVEDLCFMLHNQRRSVSRASVYRTIPLLLEAGIIREVVTPDKQLRYEGVFNRAHHDHLICIRCGSVVNFESKAVEEEQTRIARRFGFAIVNHRMELYGLCGSCDKKKGQQREYHGFRSMFKRGKR